MSFIPACMGEDSRHTRLTPTPRLAWADTRVENRPANTSMLVRQLNAPDAVLVPRKPNKWARDNTLKGPFLFRTKEKIQCLCEGARLCTRENPAKQQGGNAIPGLHSSWVGDNILAMARPWQEYVHKFSLVDAFVRANIGMILNLQEVGEHEACGPGNLPSCGFSYDPESFMAARIGFYNFSWRDMGVPDLDRMMDIVQVMDYVITIEKRRIAVHCHAGLGRTGLAIACYFVFSGMYNSTTAVATVRQYRVGALQTSQQVMFVSIFEQYLSHLRCVFTKTPTIEAEPWQQPPQQQQAPLPGAAAAAAGPWQQQQLPLGPKSGSAAPLKGQPALASLPAPIEVVTNSNGMKTETYSSGLTIVRPKPKAGSPTSGWPEAQGQVGMPMAVPMQYSQDVGPARSLQGAGGNEGGAGITDHELGLDRGLPWTAHFQIQPSLFTPHWQPHPPSTYQEALRRQQRLVHGPTRRAYLHLHRFVKTAVFTIIDAAKVHRAVLPSPRKLAAAAAVSSAWGAQQQLPYGGAYSGGPGSAGAPAGPPLSFAHAVCACIAGGNGGGSGKQRQLDPAALLSLAQAPGYQRFCGNAVVPASVASAAAKVKLAANLQEYQVVLVAPLAAVLLALEDFFTAFDPDVPSLTADGLVRMAKIYTQLPFAMPAGVPAGMQMAAAAHLLVPLPASDQELLLLMAGMLRHVARASGAGCEQELVHIGRWISRLLLGALSSSATAEEAVLSWLWWLLRNDAAYAALILVRKQRLERRHHHTTAEEQPPLQHAAAAAGSQYLLPQVVAAVPGPGAVPAPGLQRQSMSGVKSRVSPVDGKTMLKFYQQQPQQQIWHSVAPPPAAAQTPKLPGLPPMGLRKDTSASSYRDHKAAIAGAMGFGGHGRVSPVGGVMLTPAKLVGGVDWSSPAALLSKSQLVDLPPGVMVGPSDPGGQEVVHQMWI